MTHMLRKQIYIPKRQQVILKRLAKARGLSEGETYWQPLEREVAANAARPVVSDRSALEDFIRFGLTRQTTTESTPRTWTRDELYDERLSRYPRSE